MLKMSFAVISHLVWIPPVTILSLGLSKDQR